MFVKQILTFPVDILFILCKTFEMGVFKCVFFCYPIKEPIIFLLYIM